MEDEDALLLLPGASLAALRRHLGGGLHSPQLRVDLFQSLWREWEATSDPERGGDFLRAVVACELHDQLMDFVLQLHATDALNVMEKFVSSIACECFASEEEDAATAPAVTAMAIAALTVALTLGVDKEDLPHNDIGPRIQAIVDAGGQRVSALRGVLVLLKIEEAGRETEEWRAFEALPFELDGQLATTRSGRARAQAMSGLLHQHQRGLQAFLSDSTREEERSVAEQLLEIARDLLAWIEKRTPVVDSLDTHGTCVSDEAIDASEARDRGSDFLMSEAELEAYLTSKSVSPDPEIETSCSGTPLEPAYRLGDDSSPIEKLIEAFFSHLQTCEVPETANHIAAAHAELAAVRELETLQVQVAYLLAWQLEAGRSFVDDAPLKAQDLERVIQRELNSLTETSASARAEPKLRSLLSLAAFCPRRLIELVVRGAQTVSLHHAFYLKLLAACPMLVKWEDPALRPAGRLPVFKSELQRMVKEVTSDTAQFDEQGRHVVSFLSSLVGVTECPQVEPVARLAELLRDVLLPPLAVCGDQVTGDSTIFRAYHLLQQLCSDVATTNRESLPSVGSSGVMLFQLVAQAYASLFAATSSESLRVRETLLLLAKDALKLLVSDASVTDEELALDLPPPLIDRLRSDPAFATLVGRAIPLAFDAFVGPTCKESVADENALTLDQAKASAEASLWGLLWATLTPTKLVLSQAPKLWRRLDNLASLTDIQADDSPASQVLVGGASVIQAAAVSVLLSCGEHLGRSFRDNVVPYLLMYEPVDSAKCGIDTLTLPLPRRKSGQPVPDEMTVSLKSLHCVARYLVEGWSLAALKLHRDRPDLLFGMLRGVVSACDSAVTASTASSPQLLVCLQWECYLAFVAHELELDGRSWWSALAAQLEMSLLRILHALARVDALSPDQVAVSREFVAVWLTMLPRDSFAAVFRYLHVNHERTIER